MLTKTVMGEQVVDLTGLTSEGRAGPPPPRAKIIDLEVTFQRRGAPLRALRGVTLEIGPGEILAVVGESGSGKSVLGLSMLGLLTGDPPPNVSGRGGGVRHRHGHGLALRIAAIFARPISGRCSRTP